MSAPIDAPDLQARTATADLTQEWLRFLRALDGVYEELAALRDQPYEPLAGAELCAAAEAAAGTGMHPYDLHTRGMLWPPHVPGAHCPEVECG